jgi:hypothetical protein
VRNIGISCEDETTPRIDFVQLRARFTSERRFGGFIARSSDTAEFYYRVDGTLRSQGRRARGSFFWIRNADAMDAPDAVDCSSGRGWRAKRVR